MDNKGLKNLFEEYQLHGLYTDSLKRLSVSIHRHIEYANNVFLIESNGDVADDILLAYSIFEEMPRCFFCEKLGVEEFIRNFTLYEFPVAKFINLYSTHFRKTPIFNLINTAEIESVLALQHPAYDDWCGEFLLRTKSKKYVLMWDYSD
ncbi:hypothetical protein [Flocculibacter collagenilyticus]|uniref:hypothetical protein n=1 Tax=Flocculibacter collagenilyticus TaxID=2744479 RepID=UPI0018F72901|nr:hypothetical protein [Flocculibacter collagenilyticus]